MSYEVIFCGSCAINVYAFPKDDRKKMAMKLKAFTIYQCIECGKYLYYDTKQWHKSEYLDYVKALHEDDMKKKKPLVM